MENLAARIDSEREKKTDITAAAAWPKNSAAGGGDLVIQVSSFGVGQRQGPDRNAAEREKGSRSTGRPEGLFFFFCPIPPMYGASQVWLNGWAVVQVAVVEVAFAPQDTQKVETRRHGTKKSRAKRGTLHMHQIE